MRGIFGGLTARGTSVRRIKRDVKGLVEESVREESVSGVPRFIRLIDRTAERSTTNARRRDNPRSERYFRKFDNFRKLDQQRN